MSELKKLENMLTQGKISRRDFLVRVSALGLTAALSPALSLSPASASVPKKGGRLIEAFEKCSPNDTLDPCRVNSQIDATRSFQIYNGLVSLGVDLKPQPELAESWEGSKTADEWVFKLRKGVEFHDGRDFRAEDVAYTIRRNIDPEVGCSGKPLWADLEPNGIKVEDKHTIRFRLLRPNTDFPVIFSARQGNILPEGFEDFDHAIGTGPFKVKVWKPGLRMVAERNRNYFKSGLPRVDEVESLAISDRAARVNALLAGEVHLIAHLDPVLIDKIEKTSGVEVLATKSGNHVNFVMLCTQPPYDNGDVRLALKHLIDREKYAKIVYKGYAQVGNDHPISPLDPMYCDAIPIREYDPERAKSLLKKAGALDLTFEVHTSEGQFGGIEGALVFSQMAAKAGVKIKVVREPADGYYDAVWMKKAFCMSSWNTRPAAAMILGLGYTSKAPWNETFWRRPDFDKLLLEAKATMDEAKRRELHCEMQRMIRDDGGTIVPTFQHTLDAGSTKVKGLIPYPLGVLGGWKAHETAWLET